MIGTASDVKHEWLRKLAADELIDYTTTRFEEAVREVDVVIDLVGDEHDATSTRSLDVLRPGGLIVPVPSGASSELLERVRAHGLHATSFLVEPDGTALAHIAELINRDEIAIEVEDVLPLEQAAVAHERGERGLNRGKLVLRVSR